MTLTTYFSDFISNISLTEEQKTNLQNAHTGLQEFLAKEESIRDVYVTTFLQGSYRRSTALKPVNGEASDVDVVLVTTVNYNTTKPSDFLKLFYNLISSHYRHCRMQGRSIGIELGDVSMDLVPVAVINPNRELPGSFIKMYRNSTTLENLMVNSPLPESDSAAYSHNNPLMLSDRKTEEWERTHPLAQLEWTHNKNNRCNGYFLHVVKAIKWWHKSQHPEQDHPNSYPLEHFIGECCPDYIESVAEGVVKTFETMLQYNEKPNLSDRGVPEHDVFGRVTEAEYQSFYNAVNKAALLARKAYDSTRIEESASLWCQLFGSEFPTPPKKQVSFTNRTEPTTTVPRGNFA